jgi:glycosyltransferase involved in cell wall biosynthesis
MPFLNAEPYIGEAIRSVEAQRYPHWELILVNDGSSDGSAAVALEYARSDAARIRYLEHPGGGTRGASASRNRGLAAARGEYIAFLDADDVYLPGKLEEQVEILRTRPDVGLVYGATEHWYSWSGLEDDRARDVIPDLRVPREAVIQPPHLLHLFLTRQAPTPCTCSVLVRRGVIADAGGFEDSFRYIYTDQVLYTKLFLHSAAFVSDGCWDRYRRHPDSCYSRVKSSGQGARARDAYLQWARRYFREQGVRDLRLVLALEREIWVCKHPRSHHLLARLNRKRRAAVEHLRRRAHSLRGAASHG